MGSMDVRLVEAHLPNGFDKRPFPTSPVGAETNRLEFLFS